MVGASLNPASLKSTTGKAIGKNKIRYTLNAELRKMEEQKYNHLWRWLWNKILVLKAEGQNSATKNRGTQDWGDCSRAPSRLTIPFRKERKNKKLVNYEAPPKRKSCTEDEERCEGGLFLCFALLTSLRKAHIAGWWTTPNPLPPSTSFLLFMNFTNIISPGYSFRLEK